MKCQNCGAINDESDIFCGDCGCKLEKPVETSPITVVDRPIDRYSQPNIEIIRQQMEDACPKCHRDDRVTRVKSAFMNGVRTETTSGPTVAVGVYGGKLGVGIGGSSHTGISQSIQSARLSPPELKKKGNGCGLIILILIIGGAIDTVISSSSGHFVPIFSIVAVVGGIFVILGKRKKNDEIEGNYNMLMAEWETLYYCERDDVVFKPGSNKYMSVDEMQSYFANHTES